MGESDRKTGFVLATTALVLAVGAYSASRGLLSSRGLRATYAVDDPPATVHARTEAVPRFDTGVRLRSVLTNHWDVERLGIPREFPAFRVRWEGFLSVPDLAGDGAVRRRPGLVRRLRDGVDFTGRPRAVDVVDDVSLSVLGDADRPAPAPYSVEWSGELHVDQGGEYRFWLASDDGSWLFVDDLLVVDNGGVQSLRERSGTVSLDAGHHPFLVRFQDRGALGILRVHWAPPGESRRRLIPPAALFHRPARDRPPSLFVDANVDFEIDVGDTVRLEGRREERFHRSGPLPPGTHPFRAEVRIREPDREVRFRPAWTGPDGLAHPLPARRLTLTRNGSPGPWLLDTVALLVVVAAAGAAWRFPAWRRLARGYLLWLWRHRIVAAVGLILLVAAGLRVHDYDVVPYFLETYDEFKTGWIGWNLLHTGMPTGWTLGEPGPGTFVEQWFGREFVIARVKLHPPPLFPLLTGLASVAAGTSHMFEVSLSVIRLPAIACSLLATLLVFALARRCYADTTALVAALVYATLPSAVASARLAKEENLLAVLALGAVLATLRYLDTGDRRFLYLAAVASGLGPLTKETGIYLGAVVFFLLARRRRWPDIARAAPLYLGLWGLYFVYCWWYASDALRIVGGIERTTATGLSTVAKLFTSGRIVAEDFGRGWAIWLALCLMAAPVRRRWAVIGPVVAYLLVLAVGLGQHFDYGWYRIPLYPFLSIAGGVFLVGLVREADLFRASLFIILGLMTSVTYALPGVLWQSPWPVRWILLLCLLPFAADLALRGAATRRLARATAILLVAAFLAANVAVALRFVAVYPSGF